MIQSEQILNNLFGEHCGLNADWSVMAWAVYVSDNNGVFIIDNEIGENNYSVIKRYYAEELYNTDKELVTLFSGTARECVNYLNEMQFYPNTAAALGKAWEKVVGYDIYQEALKINEPMTANQILNMMWEYDCEDDKKPFSKFARYFPNEDL